MVGTRGQYQWDAYRQLIVLKADKPRTLRSLRAHRDPGSEFSPQLQPDVAPQLMHL